LVLRTDKDWRSDRLEVPWVTTDPTAYIERFARFVIQPEDAISPHNATTTDAIGGDTSKLVVYGSRLPYWDNVSTDAAFNGWSPEERERCLSGNALEFYPRLAKHFAASSAS
jgi:predicted TIM-barrel fold metal-dependent hydrolase